MNHVQHLEDHITKATIHYRGGGVELDLSDFGYEDEYLSAYQNYLGGGLLGAVAHSSTMTHWQQHPDLVRLAAELRDYYLNLRDDFDYGDDYDDLLQNRPVSYPGL